MIGASAVAKYFLLLQDSDAGDLISNLKLQKLLYYAQGLHLALKGRPLFPEQIEAWQHGPVVPDIYHDYKEYGSSSISLPEEVEFPTLENDTSEFLREVYQVYGQFSAWKLREMTHEETPFKATPMGDVITHELMRSYFSDFVEYEEESEVSTH